MIYLARPADATAPRDRPNEHSLEARWVTLAELAALPLRGAEVAALFRWVAEGAAAHPLDLIGHAEAVQQVLGEVVVAVEGEREGDVRVVEAIEAAQEMV